MARAQPAAAQVAAEAGISQRAADVLVRFGGSWTAILVFALVLCGSVLLNHFDVAKPPERTERPGRAQQA